ncbi:archaetidylserine decarboxylase [Saccharospirillum impatiens]|uniref:archaetidylserine decarboxylase n=1 Tax=Saccharospirillum impatiens TaxID=169438 RepID=UPI0003F7B221|nr:archaetidylserine decarboxylase [Saccharospirillum impatiens]
MTLRLKDRLFVASQYLAPHHALSRLAGALAESEWGPLKRRFISTFARHYQVNMSEAERPNLDDYRNFNDFFTRSLTADARSFPDDARTLCSPVDGSVSQAGAITDGRIIQAKQQSFTVTELLGGDAEQARRYRDGEFATLYLSPKDYHRIHMPCDGTLVRTTFVPGRLFSVNGTTAEAVPRLFARNERLVCEFQTERGRMVMVLVGAMIVASIETTWAGVVAPMRRQIQHLNYNNPQLTFSRGEEMGRFRLGSTVVMLFEPNTLAWSEAISPGKQVQLGQPLEDSIGL